MLSGSGSIPGPQVQFGHHLIQPHKDSFVTQAFTLVCFCRALQEHEDLKDPRSNISVCLDVFVLQNFWDLSLSSPHKVYLVLVCRLLSSKPKSWLSFSPSCLFQGKNGLDGIPGTPGQKVSLSSAVIFVHSSSIGIKGTLAQIQGFLLLTADCLPHFSQYHIRPSLHNPKHVLNYLVI